MNATEQCMPAAATAPTPQNSRIHDLVNALLASQLRLDAIQAQARSTTLGKELDELRSCLDEAILIVKEIRSAARLERQRRRRMRSDATADSASDVRSDLRADDDGMAVDLERAPGMA